MDFDSVALLSAKLAALALFVYRLIVFADQGAGELIKGGVAYVVSPCIWGSSVAWPSRPTKVLLDDLVFLRDGECSYGAGGEEKEEHVR